MLMEHEVSDQRRDGCLHRVLGLLTLRVKDPKLTTWRKEMYRVKECSTRRHCYKYFAMIFVYFTSWTRKILHRAVAGDDCQN